MRDNELRQEIHDAATIMQYYFSFEKLHCMVACAQNVRACMKKKASKIRQFYADLKVCNVTE